MPIFSTLLLTYILRDNNIGNICLIIHYFVEFEGDVQLCPDTDMKLFQMAIGNLGLGLGKAGSEVKTKIMDNAKVATV